MGKDILTVNKMSKRGKTAPKQPEKFRAHKYARPGLSEDEVEEIKEAFDLFDNDGSGAISVNELTSAMQSLGFDVKQAVVYNMVADLDSDGSGEIEFGEFLDVMTAKLSEKNTREEIDRVFNLFDKDRSNELSVEEFMKICKEVGQDADEADVRELVKRCDLDGDGTVTKEDFYNVITKRTFEDA